VAGAAIGSAVANSRAQAAENNAYCSQRYKSYDPGSGTYLGYDGDRHPCP
ncbi:BA14K family protein, partial [Bradyrhizobium genomosp. I (2014)]